MRTILSLIFGLLLSTAALPSHAAVEDGTIISTSFVSPLMQWVEHATGTKVPSLPRVTASTSRLKTTMGLQGARQARSMAAYIPGQVVLSSIAWDDESVRSTSYLVHELVHHAQVFSKKTYACPQAKEFEAYALQNQWLAEHGEDPIVTEGFIRQMASCGNA